MNKDFFLFPIESIDQRNPVPLDLDVKSLADLDHFVDGSNARIYTFNLNRFISQRAVAKLINYKLTVAIAEKEFRIETEILLRCQHPNIVNILGAGCVPQIFLCLEYLQGGTLQDMLVSEKKRGISGIVSRFIIKRSGFKELDRVVRLSIELVSALKYLHDDFHPDACIIHRDLKPDNIGFTKEGRLKLFDFGMSICVKKRSSLSESYQMTGFTGSPRYMAPEVYRGFPYTEKIDVHSFGIILWQLCSKRVPYNGYTREQLESMVMVGGHRPELLGNIPDTMQRVMTACWNPDPGDRPPFSRVLEELNAISAQLQPTNPLPSSSSQSSIPIRGMALSLSSSSPSSSLSFLPPIMYRSKKPLLSSYTTTSSEDITSKEDDVGEEMNIDGGGSFGEIFEVRNLKTGEDCAAKEEIIKVPVRRHSTFEGKSKEICQEDGEDYKGNEVEELGQNETKFIPSHLRRECKIYNKLAGEVGIPKVRWFGMVPGNSSIGRQDSNIMVMDLLGNSLEDLFNYCNRKFSLKTVLVLAFELVCRIETIQVKGYLIHRDIKPENFLVGKGRERHTVYIIDFGLAKYYKNPRTGKHIPKKDGNSLTGTARYASINSHMGKEQSRRDDLMSVGYVLMYFLRGQLPWQGLKAETNNEKYKLILEKKMTTTTEELCNGFPDEFKMYFEHVKSLRFADCPNYSHLKSLFKDLFLRLNYTYDNILFDWEILAYQRAAAAAN